jgi:hypothetical protein
VDLVLASKGVLFLLTWWKGRQEGIPCQRPGFKAPAKGPDPYCRYTGELHFCGLFAKWSFELVQQVLAPALVLFEPVKGVKVPPFGNCRVGQVSVLAAKIFLSAASSFAGGQIYLARRCAFCRGVARNC